MKKYNFNYTDQRITWLILILAIVSYVGLVLLLVKFTRIDPLLQIFLPALLAIAIFILNKKTIRKNGVAYLHEDNLELNLNGRAKKVEFKNLSSYQTYAGRKGATLQFNFKNGKTLKIIANNTFCNTNAIELLGDDSKKVIGQYEIANQLIKR